MLTRKLLSVIDNIIVDVFKIICCNLQSELSDSFMVNITVAQLPGHKVLQPGHVPRLPPPPLGAATAVHLRMSGFMATKQMRASSWLQILSADSNNPKRTQNYGSTALLYLSDNG